MQIFGTLDGRAIHEVTLQSLDAEIKIIEYGAVVRDCNIRGANGRWQRVVLGLNSVEDYVQHAPHFGAIAGRYANRIRDGRFTLDGVDHRLVLNQDGKHHLHGGGPTGFGKRPWTIVHCDPTSVTLSHVSPDGTNGYPGTLQATCRYSLLGRTLRIELSAITDRATVVNLCHHSYFNLDGATDILDHTLQIDADAITAVDADLIPNGELTPVAGGVFDFRAQRAMRLMASDGQRHWYDHNFVLRRNRVEPTIGGMALAHAATFASPRSGLALQTWTTEPGLQVYDGFKLNVPVPGLDQTRYGPNAGLCLEPQHYPDSPNHPHFPSTVLRPGNVYRQVTEYRFLDASASAAK